MVPMGMEKFSKFQMATLVSLLLAQSACLDEEQAPATELIRPDAPVQVQPSEQQPQGVEKVNGAQAEVEQQVEGEGAVQQPPAGQVQQEAVQQGESTEQDKAPAKQEDTEAAQGESSDTAANNEGNKPVAKPMHPFEKNRPVVKAPAGAGSADTGKDKGTTTGGTGGGSEDHSETCETE